MENANQSTDVFLGLHDFLERMRQPSAADFVKSIKSFIVSFSNNAPDPEKDSAAVQQFFSRMEVAFRAHPLWAGCSEEELESAGEGLEKYVMTKLFTRVFASLPDDVNLDNKLYEKMALIQQFIRPENLDIKSSFQNETSWLLAQKELQKINMYKAPRDKLVCILNCCKVINNLLLNASIASNENPPGADEFLPVLIYVTIKANPPQLHSNLLYIQRYRNQSRLIAETAYYFTNMLSAESFISNIDAEALSMDETEFENNMESARAVLSGISTDLDGVSSQSDWNAGQLSTANSLEPKYEASDKKGKGADVLSKNPEKTSLKEVPHTGDDSSTTKSLSISDLENTGASMLLKEDPVSQVFQQYPYLFSHAGDLTVTDVEGLLNNYKQLVFKYVCLFKGLSVSGAPLSESQTETQSCDKPIKEGEDSSKAVEQSVKSQTDSGEADDYPDSGSPFEEQNFEPKLPNDEALAEKGGAKDEGSSS